MSIDRAPAATGVADAILRPRITLERRRVVATLAVLGVVWVVLAEAASLDAYTRFDGATVVGHAIEDALLPTVYMVAGLVAWTVRPASRIGLWMYLTGVLFLVGNLGNTQVPGLQQVAAGLTDLYHVPIGIIVLTYPTGYFGRRSHKALAIAATVWLLVYAALVASYLDPAVCVPPVVCPANPFLVIRDRDVAHGIYEAGQLVGGLLWLVFAALLGQRWLRSSSLSRRLLMPVWVAGLMIAAGGIASTLLAWAAPGDLASAFDFWVNNLVLACVLPLVFLAGLLRERLARASIADFVEEVGRGVSLGALRDSFARLVGDRDLMLAFPLDSGGYVDANGMAIELPAAGSGRRATPIDRAGERVAVVIHDEALDTDPALVRAAGAAAGLALENERLAAEVRARLEAITSSRARLVEAADAERVRIERMLHDGAQQRLVALAVRLRSVSGSANDADVRARLEALGVELDDALKELRELARGIHPAVLVQAGLKSAIDSLAQRSPVPVEVDVVDRRFTSAVETTAYYVVSEALANAARHSGASRIVVAGSVTRGVLDLTIRDDGVGGATADGGSGIRGLEDRVGAVGGAIDVRSPAGGGTVVHVALPLEPSGRDDRP